MVAVAVAPMVTADKQQLAFLLAGAPGVSFCLNDILASNCMTSLFATRRLHIWIDCHGIEMLRYACWGGVAEDHNITWLSGQLTSDTHLHILCT